MIRLRAIDGRTMELPDMAFVEICDADANVAQVTYQDAEGGMHVLTEGDPEAEQYKKLFPSVKFVKIQSL